jgi:hypothetical protein
MRVSSGLYLVENGEWTVFKSRFHRSQREACPSIKWPSSSRFRMLAAAAPVER